MKKKPPYQITYTTGKLGIRQYFEPDFKASIYFDRGASIFVNAAAAE